MNPTNDFSIKLIWEIPSTEWKEHFRNGTFHAHTKGRMPLWLSRIIPWRNVGLNCPCPGSICTLGKISYLGTMTRNEADVARSLKDYKVNPWRIENLESTSFLEKSQWFFILLKTELMEKMITMETANGLNN